MAAAPPSPAPITAMSMFSTSAVKGFPPSKYFVCKLTILARTVHQAIGVFPGNHAWLTETAKVRDQAHSVLAGAARDFRFDRRTGRPGTRACRAGSCSRV